MGQLRHGARRSLEYLYADLNDIIEHAHNPGAVRTLAQKCLTRVREEIEPKLQRADPKLEEQVKDLVARVERLEQQKIVVLPEQRRKAE